MNESYRQRQVNRLQARYANAVTSSTAARSATLVQQEFPDLSNRFSGLENEDSEPTIMSSSSKSSPKAVQRIVSNPWSTSNPPNSSQKASKRNAGKGFKITHEHNVRSPS